MWLGLCVTSAQGLWILVDPLSKSLVGYKSIFDSDSSGLASHLDAARLSLLKETSLEPNNITKIFGVSGPGGFTGLRMAGAFLKGFAQSLNIELVPVPTYDLFEKTFFIPLRHQPARQLSLSEALGQGIEFLKISGPQIFSTAVPQADDLILGLKDCPLWPTPEQFCRAIAKPHNSKSSFEIIYGLNPKIFGKRI